LGELWKQEGSDSQIVGKAGGHSQGKNGKPVLIKSASCRDTAGEKRNKLKTEKGRRGEQNRKGPGAGGSAANFPMDHRRAFDNRPGTALNWRMEVRAEIRARKLLRAVWGKSKRPRQFPFKNSTGES